jgi:hypothetical protein
MRPNRELLEGTPAANSREPDGGVHRAERAGMKARFLDRSVAGLFHFGKRSVYPEAKCGRTRDAGSERASVCVLDASTAARAAAVNADEQRARV